MISSSAQLAAGGQAVGDRLDDLADQRHVGRLQRQRVEHRVHAALERVLDRRQRPLDPPLLDGQHDVAQRRQRHGLARPGAAAVSASSLTVPGGPR